MWKSGRGELSQTFYSLFGRTWGAANVSDSRNLSLFSQTWLGGGPFLTSSGSSPLYLWLPREILEDLLSVTSMAAQL